jgi:hypothetical protein
MDITHSQQQIKHLIKSNLISTGLLASQIEVVIEQLYQDLIDLLDVKDE